MESQDRMRETNGPNPAFYQDLAVIEQVGNALVITFTTENLSGPNLGAELQAMLSDALGAGGRHLVLDMQNVSYMDSSCINALVMLLNKMRNTGSGARAAVVNAGHNVQYLFRLCRLERLFPICRDVMAALMAVENG
ncbi:MAG: anti-sigma factor antagonist [Planctomycetes bacterium]|nr:anti-sigma factor antagonist [Planctomycetota bacterium]NOG54757.1 STAS domain-containing protein [Planctomycetota bacterium]